MSSSRGVVLQGCPRPGGLYCRSVLVPGGCIAGVSSSRGLYCRGVLVPGVVLQGCPRPGGLYCRGVLVPGGCIAGVSSSRGLYCIYTCTVFVCDISPGCYSQGMMHLLVPVLKDQITLSLRHKIMLMKIYSGGKML